MSPSIDHMIHDIIPNRKEEKKKNFFGSYTIVLSASQATLGARQVYLLTTCLDSIQWPVVVPVVVLALSEPIGSSVPDMRNAPSAPR